MTDKEQLFEHIRNIMHDNGITVYSLSKILNINRSTLQKAIYGKRPMTPRHFKAILNLLPLSTTEINHLYDAFLELNWGKEYVVSNRCIVDILDTIEKNINCQYTESVSFPIISLPKGTVFGKNDILNVSLSYLYTELKSNTPLIYTYLPMYNSFFSNSITSSIRNSNADLKVSVIFDLLKSSGYMQENNLLALKQIIPLVLDCKKRYDLHYFYVESYNYSSFSTVYPFYVILSEYVLLFSSSLDNMAIITDTDIVKQMQKSHLERVSMSTLLTVENMDLLSNLNYVSYLMNSHIYSNDMYAISYEPCLSSYVPVSMYRELIDADFPNRKEVLEVIDKRLCQILAVNSRYIICNKDSLMDFAKNGRILPFEYPGLKHCTPKQRKQVLENLLNAMDNKEVIMRAFSSDKLNVVNNFELNDIQGNYDFKILVYGNDGFSRLIDIHEPVISKCFERFVKDVMETDLTYTYEETRQFVENAILEVDNLIKNN